MIEPTKDEVIDSLMLKINALENRIKSISDKYNTTLEGLKVILDAGDCGGIAEKTLEEVNNSE